MKNTTPGVGSHFLMYGNAAGDEFRFDDYLKSLLEGGKSSVPGLDTIMKGAAPVLPINGEEKDSSVDPLLGPMPTGPLNFEGNY